VWDVRCRVSGFGFQISGAGFTCPACRVSSSCARQSRPASCPHAPDQSRPLPMALRGKHLTKAPSVSQPFPESMARVIWGARSEWRCLSASCPHAPNQSRPLPMALRGKHLTYIYIYIYISVYAPMYIYMYIFIYIYIYIYIFMSPLGRDRL